MRTLEGGGKELQGMTSSIVAMTAMALLLAAGMIAYAPGTVAQTLNEALDNAELVFTTGGDAPWSVEADATAVGGSCARSGAISHNQTTWIETTVEGPGMLQFNWKVSSEALYDKLSFKVDNVAQLATDGEKPWETKTYDIASGSHTLRWEYTKDASDSAGQDAGWLDNMLYLRSGEWVLVRLSRTDNVMAYDSARNRTVLFGGNDGRLKGDTWEWDGTTWTQVATTGPSPRRGHAMAYDSARNRTVLFGGSASSSNPLGDTWEYIPPDSIPSPTPRGGGFLVK